MLVFAVGSVDIDGVAVNNFYNGEGFAVVFLKSWTSARFSGLVQRWNLYSAVLWSTQTRTAINNTNSGVSVAPRFCLLIA
jgi:hypothetical protein